MPKKGTVTRPYKIDGRFGILNHCGSIWSANTFETKEQAEQYKRDFENRNKNIRLDKHKVVPVRITVEAL